MYYTPIEYQEGALEDIKTHYINVTMKVEDLAIKYKVTPRTIQRLLKKHGFIRTIPEANRVTAKLKDYSSLRVPDDKKAKRKSLPLSLRYKVLSATPYCVMCGNKASDSALQIDHIDGDASNNLESNLQVLCIYCNQGKK